ncbi:MAG: zinc-ribbon domain-containing protein [Anaerolineae bacterium]
MNCNNCGHANPPGTKFCRQCGTPLRSVSPAGAATQRQAPAAGGTPCVQCGATVPAGQRFCTQCGTPVSSTTQPPTPDTIPEPDALISPPGDSIQASLARLGIPLSRRQLIGFGLAVLAGMIVARILPFIYGPIFDPLLTPVFGSGAGPRDTFNSFMMTALTFLTSFVISFIVFRKPQGG